MIKGLWRRVLSAFQSTNHDDCVTGVDWNSIETSVEEPQQQTLYLKQLPNGQLGITNGLGINYTVPVQNDVQIIATVLQSELGYSLPYGGRDHHAVRELINSGIIELVGTNSVKLCNEWKIVVE